MKGLIIFTLLSVALLILLGFGVNTFFLSPRQIGEAPSISCFPTLGFGEPIPGQTISLPQDPEGDCGIISLAHANFELNNKKTLQAWYDEIKKCAVDNKLYDKAGVKNLNDMDKIRTLCKAKISQGLTGNVETFTIITRTPANPNPLDCPPLRPGDRVQAIFQSTVGPTPPGVVPVGTSHAVSCKVNLACSGLDCTDRITNNGIGQFFTYSVIIDPQGSVNGPGSPVYSTTLQEVSRPNP